MFRYPPYSGTNRSADAAFMCPPGNSPSGRCTRALRHRVRRAKGTAKKTSNAVTGPANLHPPTRAFDMSRGHRKHKKPGPKTARIRDALQAAHNNRMNVSDPSANLRFCAHAGRFASPTPLARPHPCSVLRSGTNRSADAALLCLVEPPARIPTPALLPHFATIRRNAKPEPTHLRMASIHF